MKTCDNCQNVDRNSSKNPQAWLCDMFPQARTDPLTGAELPPKRYCREALRLTCPNDTLPCSFFKALPETDEAVVTENRGEISVTFPDKEKKAV